ncbi:MAG: 30S ribosomal protein S12 methylthiotransferase RimO [Oscillospiraceae bacterium]|nr:30S ribosomal protein S12 methylthiotransferase RimO [Oscillospiraceae bacterium]
MDELKRNGRTLALVSLGCAKNLVNSEEMLALLDEAGYTLVESMEEADAVVINTCGFINDAKQEAIDNILAAAAIKAEKPGMKIIVTGCLSQRYRREIPRELPEVDALLGTADYQSIVSVVDAAFAEEEGVQRFSPLNSPVPELPRLVTTGPHWAYFRIAEGCDNRCAYCVIPSLRGPFRSRSMEALLEEAKGLAECGIRELIVIAQDITRYGTDFAGRPMLSELLRELCKLDFHWIRLHYLYPEMVDDELIETVASEEKIVKYLDIPIQHINDTILRRMNRRGDGRMIRELFGKLRSRMPELVLRTSLITGLPGEDEAAFEELCAFLREAKIQRAGVFPFSPEEGTPAAAMEDRVDTEEAERRAGLIMELQQQIMDEWNDSLVGKTLEVFVQGEEDGCCWGRSYADSPDIDGRIWLESDVPAGSFVQVRIERSEDGDLWGTPV